MNIVDLLLPKLPLVKEWINMTLAVHAPYARSMLDYNFQEIPKYFSQETLASAKVVVVEKVPMPPLSQMGLSQLGDFEKGNYSGVAYLDTYFLVPQEAHNESIHFHELCHIAQWKYLGLDKFLIAYAVGLLRHGYRNSPLEVMAYEYQQMFGRGMVPFDIEEQIKNKLNTIIY